MRLIDKIYTMQNQMYSRHHIQPTKVSMNKATRDALRTEVAPFLVQDDSIDPAKPDIVLNMELRINENLADGQILLSE